MHPASAVILVLIIQIMALQQVWLVFHVLLVIIHRRSVHHQILLAFHVYQVTILVLLALVLSHNVWLVQVAHIILIMVQPVLTNACSVLLEITLPFLVPVFALLVHMEHTLVHKALVSVFNVHLERFPT